MVLNIASSVAVYCQRCGKIHIFDIPFFSGESKNILRCDNCSNEIAEVCLKRGKGVVIKTYCGVCKKKNSFVYPMEKLNKKSFEKIFCIEDGFELGYIGSGENIAEFLNYTQAEYEAVYANDNFTDNGQILLEAVNRVHDLAEIGAIVCPCESHSFYAKVNDDAIILKCQNCKSCAVIPAKISDDLKQIKKGMKLKFLKNKKKIILTPH